MRSILAPIVLTVLAGCSSLQRPSPAQRAAVSGSGCDSAASIAAERAELASVARTLADIANGSGANAYSTSEPRVATPPASVAAPSATAAAAASSMMANANNARVELWYGEARQDRTHYDAVVARVAALDAMGRTLPTPKSCRSAGFASYTPPAG